MTAARHTSGRRELFRALGALAEQPDDAVADAVGLAIPLDRADHTHVFTFHALPYASAFLGGDGMLGGEVASRVAGFWRALGYPAPESPDHLAALLGLYAGLAEQETTHPEPARRAMLARARTALLWEHLLPWTGVFTDLVRRTGLAPWDRWAGLVDEALRQEWDGMADTADGMPRHLQHAPPQLSPTFELSHLLAPIRTGMVLTRHDLVRAARSLGLGVRLTGRLPTLDTLLGQARPQVLAWLASHARQWEKRHLDRPGPTPVSRFWAWRAANTSAVLGAILAGR